MWKPLALVAVCSAVVGSQIAAADEGNPTAVPTQPTTSESCTPIKQIYSEKNWRDPTPAAGLTPCPLSARRVRAIREHFWLYRHYRQIAPYRCTRGSEGYYAIPCYIIACESHFSWGAANSSGAVGVYQLLGWGAPYPARTFRTRVRNHEIAASLSLSNWVCA